MKHEIAHRHAFVSDEQRDRKALPCYLDAGYLYVFSRCYVPRPLVLCKDDSKAATPRHATPPPPRALLQDLTDLHRRWFTTLNGCKVLLQRCGPSTQGAVAAAAVSPGM